MGKRMRPHTLTIPKPLVPIAGKPIVQRLVEDIAATCKERIDNVGFIIKESFGKDIEISLLKIAQSIGVKAHIFYQPESLGTAHAIYCAESLLIDKCIVAYADTLFKAGFQLDFSKEGVIWVYQVEESQVDFGLVKVNDQNIITDFIERPTEKVSSLAIIGIYYFRRGEDLKREIKHLIHNKIMGNGEYQLTDALENMKNAGAKFVPAVVKEWLDCGNKNATVYTNQRYLEFIKNNRLIAKSAQMDNGLLIPPVFLGENVKLTNSVIGPYVSIGNNTKIKDCRISNSIIQRDSSIKNAVISNSMIGSDVYYEGKMENVSIGDFTQIQR